LNYRDALVSNTRDAVCGWMGVQDNLNRLGQDTLAALVRFSTGGILTPVRLPNPAGFWYQLLCNRPSPPAVPPPYTGGQCDGVQYDVTVITTRTGVGCSPASNSSGTTRVWGPVEAVFLEPVEPATGNQSQVLTIRCRGKASDPIQPAAEVNAGLRSNLANADCPAPTIVDIQVVRVDGQPDDCGDPDERIPPPYPSPRPIIVAPSFTWIDNDANVRIQPSFRIRIGRPSVTINPSVRIPIDIDLGNPSGAPAGSFSPTVNIGLGLDGSISIGIGGDTIINPPDPDDVLPDPNPIPVPDTPKPVPTKPENIALLYGAVVTARQVGSSRTTLVQLNGDPSLYAPDAATLNFVYQAGKSKFFGRPHRINHGKQVIYTDNEFQAVDVRVSARPGWDVDVVTLVREVPKELGIFFGYTV